MTDCFRAIELMRIPLSLYRVGLKVDIVLAKERERELEKVRKKEKVVH